MMKQKLRLMLYVKMLIGFMLGFLVAYFAKLPYSYTAGVIAILHLWYSRDTVFKAALTRLSASLVGLTVSALLFYLFGYEIWNLFLMVLVVLTILYLLRLEYGATIALVLIGQQWAEQTAWAPLNALFIMLIGTGAALFLNSITFRSGKNLNVMKAQLDHEISNVFATFNNSVPYDFSIVKAVLKKTNETLQISLDNYRVANIDESFAYINTRASQISILERIVNDLNMQPASPYKDKIIDFLLLFKTRIGTEDFATPLLDELEKLYGYYRGLPLPVTREEFEHRALLFVTLAHIKQFLDVKIAFHRDYPRTLTTK